jgi:hypothetical protein
MARPREPSVGLTPSKRGEKHAQPQNIPSVQESPLNIENLGDEEQDVEGDSGGAEGNRRTLPGEADPIAQAAEDEAEDADVGQEASTDRDDEGDLVRAGDGLVRASGRIGGVAQHLQGEPTTPQGRSLQDNPFGDSAGTPEEDPGSEAEAERSAARLNAVTRLSIRSRQDSGTLPTNPRGTKRTTMAAYRSSENLPAQSIATGTPPTGHTYTNNTRASKPARKSTISAPTVPQSLSPSKRKRGPEIMSPGNPIRRYSGSGRDQASTNSTNATLVSQPSRPGKLQRPNRINYNMTASGKTQNVAPQTRTDIYTPQSSPEKTKAAAKQAIRTTQASSAKSKNQHVLDRSHIGTRTRQAGRGIHNQQHSGKMRQEGAAEDQLFEAEEDGVEATEPSKKLRRGRSERQQYTSPITSSAVPTTGRITRTNPTGNKAVSQNPVRKQAVRPVSSGSKNASRVVSQKTRAQKEVAEMVLADSPGSTGMRTRVPRRIHAAGGLGRRTDQETRYEHHEQPSPDHHARQGHERRTRAPLPAKPSSSQSPGAEDSDAGDVAQSGESNDSEVEEYVDPGNKLSAEEKLELIMDYVYDIRGKRGSTRKYRTEVIGEFLEDIDDMRLLYTRLGKEEQGTDQYDKLREELDMALEGITDRSHSIVSRNIRILPEEGPTIDIIKERRATLEDLYTWAIPDLILAIKKAVDCYPDRSIPSPELRRIVGLQDVVINLGDSKWRRGIRTGKKSREVLKRLSHAVLPNIRKLRQDYKKELEERRRARDRRLKENLQRRIADEERRRREREREIRRRRRIINGQVLSELARTDPKYSANRRSQSQRRGDGGRLPGQDEFAGNKPNEWPKAELLALVQGLEKFTGKHQLLRSIVDAPPWSILLNV